MKTIIAATAAVISVIGCGSTAPDIVSPPNERFEAFRPLEVIPIDPLKQSFTEQHGAPEYVIGPGDEVEISLRGVTVTSERSTVRPDGYVSYSLLENVRAAGMTPTELDDLLTHALAEFLREPKVDVEVVAFKSKQVSLMGAVLQQASVVAGGGGGSRGGGQSGQGRYALKGRTTVLDLILMAGGTRPGALLDRVQLIRAGRSYQLDIQRVLSTGNQSHNIVLQGEDIVIVPGANPRSKKVIVLGEVNSPNVYMFAEDARILEALTQAGGVTEAALRDDIRLIRVVDGERKMFSINFQKLTELGDMQQNLALRTDDIVFVPRTFMGDINDVLNKAGPLLSVLLLPATYRDLYSTGGGLRIDTGTPTEGAATFTRTLPGTSAKPVAAEGAEEEGSDGGAADE